MPNAIIFCLFGNGLTSHILIPSSTVFLNLLPWENGKSGTSYARMIGTSFGSKFPCSQTPYPHLTFQFIRFTLIKALTWHITIKPSQTSFVLKHHKCSPLQRTYATLDKRSRAIVLCPPLFSFLFSSKKNIQASFGNRQSCEPLNLFHINVGIIVMPADFIPLVGSSCQQHVPSSSIFGTLKGLGPERSLVPGASSLLMLADSRLCKIYNEYETCKMQYVRGGSCRTGWVWINVYWLENLLPWSRIGYPMCFQGGFGKFLLSMN